MIPGISKPHEDEIKTDQHRCDGGQHENDLQSAVFPAVIIIIIVRVIGIPVFPGKQSHQALSRFFVFFILLFPDIAVIGRFLVVFFIHFIRHTVLFRDRMTADRTVSVTRPDRVTAPFAIHLCTSFLKEYSPELICYVVP